MVVVVGRFLGKVEFFSADDNSLEQARFVQGV
jgi:hypothetical protein